jgi:yecA family protein
MHLRSPRAWYQHVRPGPATSTLDYDQLHRSLTDAGAVVALAELHGGVCGALCAGGSTAARRWLAQSFEDEQTGPTTEVVRELDELVAATERALADDELTFEPLLPSDAAPLAERVAALALFCQGFLAGLGATAPDLGRERDAPAAELEEILADFVEISRAALSDDEEEREAEADFSLAEIHEYVRVGVQLCFEQLAPQRAAPERGLH